MGKRKRAKANEEDVGDDGDGRDGEDLGGGKGHGRDAVDGVESTEESGRVDGNKNEQKWPPALPEIHSKELKDQVYTHRSFSNQFTFTTFTDELDHNERLEFLGDSVIGYAVTRTIYFRFPNLREGKMTDIRSSLVCNKNLHQYGRLYEMHRALRLSIGAERDDVRNLEKIIADCFEAYLGAVVLESGEQRVCDFIDALVSPKLDELQSEFRDELPINRYAKNHLYHLLKGGGAVVDYRWVDGEGGNTGGYTVALMINHEEVCRSTATNQKDASLRAAMAAIKNPALIAKYMHKHVSSEVDPTTSPSSILHGTGT